ncbi:right-handed parallel beta-helix repeat-containing protein [Dyella sedimenti]|uniref:right-handed parallel beta-helix repeat-containing protein n=1 Tax=Dyella sedimenti TaxID=2919947 RepID=UPI001FA9A91B|nr:right-handed parallel beta-helix repeat-containing protein [Dyella sedimenti]
MALKSACLVVAISALLSLGGNHAAWAAQAAPRHAPSHAAGAGDKPVHGKSQAEDPDDDMADQTDGSDEDNQGTDTNAVAATDSKPKAYIVSTGVAKALMDWQSPRIPDVSRYTESAAMQNLRRTPAGHVRVGSMLEQMSFKNFMGRDERLREWAKRQSSMPQVIFISGGYVTPRDLARALPRQYFAETQPGVFVARLPIDVQPGATLHIGKDVKDFRLSMDRGAFIVNEGDLFIDQSRLEGWDEANDKPTWFVDEKDFRPFIVSWGGSRTYMIHSVVAHLGYAASKAYGISISQFSPSLAPVMKRGAPTGWLLNSEFFDNWYGFYCYEAEDVVIRGNTYHDNIKYGIDPHDRSRRLVIAQNTVYGTRIKHGIIVSREVNESWIVDNTSFDNTLSGIVVDRSSMHNVIALNKTYQNKSDGITIYESPNTLIWRNLVTANNRHGIRVRNSIDVQLRDNVAVGNALSGIYGHIENLNDTGRNLKLDPFHPIISMTVVGGKLVSNGSGPITIDQPLSLEVYDVDLREPRRNLGIHFTGVLGENQEKVLDIMVRQKLPVVVKPEAISVSTASK